MADHPDHPDLATEQRHLDRVCRAVTEADADAPTPPDSSPLLFGRVEFAADTNQPDSAHTIYVGRRHVTDDDGTVLAHAWYEPTAAPFYERPSSVRRRVLVQHDRRLSAVHDEPTGEPTDGAAPEHVLGPAAHAQLERFRDGILHPATATLSRQQYDAVTRPAAGVLVVAGGPGTGKTQVGLHRAAWLAHTDPGTTVTIVVPTAALRTYTRAVLPALDADSVTSGTTRDAPAGHLIVDEAHDLDRAQLDELATTHRSVTLLVDPGRAAKPAAWSDVDLDLTHIQLTTSYRVPRPLRDTVAATLARTDDDVTPPVTVRSGLGGPLVQHDDADEVAGDALHAGTAAASTDFRVGVVVASSMLEPTLRLATDTERPVGDARDGDLTHPVTVLTPDDAAGLEFDAVALVSPDAIAAEHGARGLYTAVSRCTQTLAIFHSEPLPAGLDHLATPARPAPEPDADLHTLVDALGEDDRVIVEALVRRLLST
ncbi:UvrD-like helicase family protein [Haloactinopolyspora alba]|uniref:UvrD-like helicase family protein n=1 Tax=Haloactinopolyspora alba TaxID=648780 RepID=A0A2P8EG84_9ACTN|nr:DNA/RNA helicase domain-containing protein [Haloactinopolyspora alba]PSL08479.1 UvrD-like helicase family protein [Haloactinopolyspora alba]